MDQEGIATRDDPSGANPAAQDGTRLGLTPRRWQLEAMARWEEADGHGVVSVVTGAGKTALALLLFDQLRRDHPDLRLVVIVPTLALLDQWYVALESECGLQGDDIALYSGEGRARVPGVANLLVINTARTCAPDLVSDSTFFIVDECHRAGSEENARALDVAPRWTLGLSATPVRDFDDGFERLVAPALGEIIYEYGYADARRDGIVAPVALHNFHFDLSSAEQSEYNKLSAQIARRWRQTDDAQDDLRLKQLLLRRARLVANSRRRIVACVAIAERFEGRKIIFHESIASADAIADLLDKRGERVGLYHSALAPTIRRRNLELFKLGQLSTLVTCRALDEGLNVPDASVAIVAASTRSTRQRIQRLGRVLRVAEGKEEAVVCTLYATEPERERLTAEAESLADVADTRWYEVSL
jgi:superfamily II DNA or RNA helicase